MTSDESDRALADGGGEGQDGPAAAAGEPSGLSGVDPGILQLSPAERRERGVSEDEVRETFRAVVRHGDEEDKQLGAVQLPAMAFDREVLDAANKHPVDLTGATVDSLSLVHAELRSPLVLDDATLGSLTLDEATLDGELSLEGATVTGELRAFETTAHGDVEAMGAQFQGPVVLDEATFDDDVTFDDARFEATVRARGAAFHGRSNVLDDNTSFVGADFEADADFRETDFAFTDFAGARFGDGATFEEARFDGDVVFAGSAFEGEADFDDADFEADADFSDTSFDGPANFRGVHFAGGSRVLDDDTTFEGALFRDDADFSLGVFQYATFVDAEFGGKASFRECRFHEDAEFARCEFAGPADFDETRFVEDADVSSARFEDEALFRGAEFLGEANHIEDNATFEGTTFVERADFRNATFTSGDFTNTRLGDVVVFRGASFADRADVRASEVESDAYVDFTDAEIRGGRLDQPADRWVRYDLTRASLGDVTLAASGTDADRELLDYFRFCNTSFDEFDGNEFDFGGHLEYLERNDWTLHVFEENEADFDYAVEMTPAVVETTYLRAKNAASAAGNKKAAGEFRVKRQQFARRKNWAVLGDGAEPLGSRLKNALRGAENYFLGVSCGHGMRLVRVATVFLTLPVLFGVLYAYGGPAFATSAGQVPLSDALTAAGLATLYENVYFSYISYTTIGYGGIGPVGVAARLLVASEAYLSAILAALVVYALVKRSEL